MRRCFSHVVRRAFVVRAVAAASLAAAVYTVAADDNAAGKSEPKKASLEFSRQTIDVGVVASDVEKSVRFYTEALGFTEQTGFDVPAKLAEEAGLSDKHPFHVHVLTLGDEKTATKLKLMQFKRAPGKRVDNKYIHSSYGISYLTVYVKDIDAAITEAGEHAVRPIAKGPVEIPGGQYLAIVRDPDGNLIELIGPKVDE